MSTDMTFAICATIVLLALIGLVAFLIWLDHKEAMK